MIRLKNDTGQENPILLLSHEAAYVPRTTPGLALPANRVEP